MLNRLLKNEVKKIDAFLNIGIFTKVAENEDLSESIREDAKRFLNDESSNL